MYIITPFAVKGRSKKKKKQRKVNVSFFVSSYYQCSSPISYFSYDKIVQVDILKVGIKKFKETRSFINSSQSISDRASKELKCTKTAGAAAQCYKDELMLLKCELMLSKFQINTNT